MRKGLILLATAATLGAAAIASPASARYHDGGEHRGWERGGHRDHRDRRGEEWHRERAREWRWHHRHDGYHRSGYDLGYHHGRGNYRW